MSVETLEEVIIMWETDRITRDQIVGKLLLLLRGLQQKAKEFEIRLNRLERNAAQKTRSAR